MVLAGVHSPLVFVDVVSVHEKSGAAADDGARPSLSTPLSPSNTCGSHVHYQLRDDMAIFGDVNDNRVIPLVLLSGMIFLTGMYLVYLYKWLREMLRGRLPARFCSQDGGDPFGDGSGDPYARHDMVRKQSTISAWDMEASIIHFPPTIKELPEE